MEQVNLKSPLFSALKKENFKRTRGRLGKFADLVKRSSQTSMIFQRSEAKSPCMLGFVPKILVQILSAAVAQYRNDNAVVGELFGNLDRRKYVRT